MKPVSVEVLLSTLQKLLQKQREEEKYSQQKVTEFIETKCRALEKNAST
jgi:hypothetical protein